MITSSSNSRIKQIRKLLRDRKEREASGLFFIEGLRVVGEAVQQGARVECLIVAPGLLTSSFGHDLARELERRGVAVEEVSDPVFKDISFKDGPQGLGALVRADWQALEQTRLNPGELWVALDSVQDPGNLGTILRTLDAAGGKGVFLLDHCTDPSDPTALRASTGAVFSQRLVRASLPDFAAWKKNTGTTVVGTSGGAEKDYRGVAYPDPMVLLMGSERQGLQAAHYQICDLVVSIPMAGRSDSLNLAVATGIVLYEIFYQRRVAASAPAGMRRST